MVIIVGAIGTVGLGILAEKTRKIVEITKLCCLGNIICVIIMSYLLLLPDVGAYIFVSAGFLGFFSIGVFPLALEVAVEATLEHPFFALGNGWSSSNPGRSLAKFQLPCHQLKVGDVCISLSHCNNNNRLTGQYILKISQNTLRGGIAKVKI